MSPLLWVLAAVVALGLVAWAYGAREERVPGRPGPAALRATALFLFIGGLAFPSLRGGAVGAPQRVVLLDASASMALPVRAGDPSAPTRLDSALLEVALLAPDRVYRFGVEAAGVATEALTDLVPDESRTRARPAMEAAKLGGADSVWIVTDGAWSDRREALEAADRLGLGVREIRVAADVPRAGIADVRAPRRARGGDTVRVIADLRAAGSGEADSITVELSLDGAVLARSRVERPGSGRDLPVELAFVPLAPGDDPVWRRYEVVLAEGADPLGASDRRAAWIEISEAADGAVLISTEPDWEPRFLVPALERLVLGGARGFLRLDDGRYLELATRPRVVAEDAVRRALPGARLLVVQGDPGNLPAWLAGALESHPRTLLLSRGAGTVPGAGVRLSGPLPGEWYAAEPVPPSPAAPLLTDVDLAPLPPMTELYAVDRPGDWTILEASRNRRGEARPLFIAGRRDDARWAVSPGSDWWRWAARGGGARRVYDGVFAGVVGWLVEDATSRVASLTGIPGPGEPLEWRVRPGTTGLEVSVLDEAGSEIFSSAWPDPAERVTGPRLDAGTYTVRTSAEGPAGPFESERPLEIVPDGRELLPPESSEPASLAPSVQARPAIEGRRPRPVWPFALAVLLLCAEWVWRHRIGLR